MPSAQSTSKAVISPQSNLQAVLDAGEFAVTCELGPPRGPDSQSVREKVELLRGYVDAASCTDNQGAVSYTHLPLPTTPYV